MSQSVPVFREYDKVRVMQTDAMVERRMDNKRGTVIQTWMDGGEQKCRVRFCGYTDVMSACHLMKEE